MRWDTDMIKPDWIVAAIADENLLRAGTGKPWSQHQIDHLKQLLNQRGLEDVSDCIGFLEFELVKHKG